MAKHQLLAGHFPDAGILQCFARTKNPSTSISCGLFQGRRSRGAQDPQDPGVLILSKFAGAAEELTDALIVNPNDKVEVAEAIQHALHMSQEERVARWQAMSRILWNSDVSRWAATFIKDLAANK